MRLAKLNSFLRSVTLIALLFALVSLVISGCGGGSIGTGTGDGSTIVRGKILGSSGTPLEQVQVIASSTGETALTDINGDFSLSSNVEDGQIELVLTSDVINTTATLMAVPNDATLVTATIEVDQVTGIVSTVVIEDIESAVAPTSTAAPQGTASSDKPLSTRQIYLGTIKNGLGDRVSGAVVRLVRTGTKTKSNKDGGFRLNASKSNGSEEFQITYRKLKGSFRLRNIPIKADVTVKFTLILTIEEAGIDPGSGQPTQNLNIQALQTDFS